MDGLTIEELHALTITVELVNTFACIVGHGPTRDHDLNEFAAHIHSIQHTIMSQAAARAHPDRFRLLGEIVGN